MRPDASDTSRRPADLGFDHVGVGHANSWRCDHCQRLSGIFTGRKEDAPRLGTRPLPQRRESEVMTPGRLFDALKTMRTEWLTMREIGIELRALRTPRRCGSAKPWRRRAAVEAGREAGRPHRAAAFAVRGDAGMGWGGVMLGLPELLDTAHVPETAVRLSILVPVVAAELGHQRRRGRAPRVRCTDAAWSVEEVGHA